MVDLMDKKPYVIESIYGKNNQKWLIFDGLPWFTNFIVMLWYGYVSPNQGLPNFRGFPVVTNGFYPLAMTLGWGLKVPSWQNGHLRFDWKLERVLDLPKVYFI